MEMKHSDSDTLIKLSLILLICLKILKVSSHKTKVKKNTKWSKVKPQSKLRRPSVCDVVKGKPGPFLDACIVKSKIEAFFSLLY